MTTAAEILQRSQAGDGDAAVMLSRLLDREGRYGEAVQWLERAASGGHLLAQTVLGARFISARGAPHDPVRGAALLAEAADKGQRDAAAYSAVLAATGIGRDQDWDEAFWRTKQASKLGHQRSKAALAAIGEPDLKAWFAPAERDVRSASPEIWVVPKFLPRRVCDWIIAQSKDFLRPAQVYNADRAGAVDESRTNSGTGFSLLDLDVVFVLARAKMAQAIGRPVETFETTNVLHYSVGQKFSPHFDFVDPVTPELAADVAAKGQRVGTFLVYLNDGYGGGETDFPLLKLQVKGRKGDGLFFRSADETGAPDRRTYHAGLPPTSGEKWILSQWMRNRPQTMF